MGGFAVCGLVGHGYESACFYRWVFLYQREGGGVRYTWSGLQSDFLCLLLVTGSFEYLGRVVDVVYAQMLNKAERLSVISDHAREAWWGILRHVILSTQPPLTSPVRRTLNYEITDGPAFFLSKVPLSRLMSRYAILWEIWSSRNAFDFTIFGYFANLTGSYGGHHTFTLDKLPRVPVSKLPQSYLWTKMGKLNSPRENPSKAIN